MQWQQIEGDWQQFRGRVKEQWGKLTSDDLERIDGHRDRLEGLIRERYGKAKDEAHRMIEQWVAKQPPAQS